MNLHRLDLVSLSLFNLVARSGSISKGAELGAAAAYMSPQQLNDYSKSELTRWAQVVKAAKIEAY